MKNYAAIILTVICLNTFVVSGSAQENTDSFYSNQIKQTKPKSSSTYTKSVSTNAEAAPLNDSFANATPLVLSNGTISVTTNNIDATKEAGEPVHAENAGGKSVWFSFTPTTTTVIRINTVDTTLDTLLAVYTGASVNNLTLVGYNDDCNNNCGQASTVDLMVNTGTTYYIAVDGYNDSGTVSSGSFKLAILDNGTPFQDDFALSYNLGFSHKGSIAGTNYNATIEANEPAAYTSLNPNGKSVWYHWKASASFSVAFELTENFDSQIGVYTSNVNNPTFAQLTQVAKNIDGNGYTDKRYRAVFFAESGKTYYIKVDLHTFNNGQTPQGNFQLKFYPNKIRYYTKFSSFSDRAYLSVYRPSDGIWYNLRGINDLTPYYRNWGTQNDTPIAADTNGDGGSRTIAVRNENGLKIWYIGNGGVLVNAIQWGLAGDKPVVGDFDGDGRADLCAIRNTAIGYIWYIRQSSNGALRAFNFGTTGDKPVLGDFDGDGSTDITVIRNTQNGLVWHFLKSNTGNYNQYNAFQFGVAPDVAAAEDFDGDGKTDVAVWRPSNGTWYVLRSSDNQVYIKDFGSQDCKPQPADYDGDGKADLAFFHPASGSWYVLRSGNNQTFVTTWGTATDIPVTSLSTLSQ